MCVVTAPRWARGRGSNTDQIKNKVGVRWSKVKGVYCQLQHLSSGRPPGQQNKPKVSPARNKNRIFLKVNKNTFAHPPLATIKTGEKGFLAQHKISNDKTELLSSWRQRYNQAAGQSGPERARAGQSGPERARAGMISREQRASAMQLLSVYMQPLD